MNSNFTRLWDVLEIMDSFEGIEKPVRFQMKFVTKNRLQGTGGEIIELKDTKNLLIINKHLNSFYN